MSAQLREILSEIFTNEELKYLVSSYDVVGDIGIIKIPDQLILREKEIARAILATNKKIKVVAKRVGLYSGEYRTLPLEVLAGEMRKETEHTEFGIRFRLNVEKVYFSVRSGNERRRVASLVGDGEKVLVLFSGVAPFPLMLSKFSKAKVIYGIEKNPLAHGYGVKNLTLNRKQNNIVLYLGDVRDVLPALPQGFDRVVMVLPTRGDEFLDLALRALKPEGWLHFYDMQQSSQFDTSAEKVTVAARTCNRDVTQYAITSCGHCGPKTYRICVDAKIS